MKKIEMPEGKGLLKYQMQDDYSTLDTRLLKAIRYNTPRFDILRAVETELLKRHAIRKSSFDFFSGLGVQFHDI